MGLHRKKRFKIGWVIVGIGVVVAGVLLYRKLSPQFEKVPPTIEVVGNPHFTNLKKPIQIVIEDNRGLKYFNVVSIADGEVIKLAEGSDLGGVKRVELNLSLPKVVGSELTLRIKAIDTSKWHLFAGNKRVKEVKLVVDTKPPVVSPVASSYAIGRGGSGVAIVKVEDPNLKEGYILINRKYRIELTPFQNWKGYYIALIPWPLQEQKFSAEVVGVDLAGNRREAHIPFFWRKYRYPEKRINIPDSFITSVAVPILERMGLPVPEDRVAIFKEMNEKARELNEEEIWELTRPLREGRFSQLEIGRFNPLPGSKREAGFGDFRHYYFHRKEISEAYHKGMDLAKIPEAPILLSNPGVVTATKWIGIYGNVTIVYHQLGLYTLYAHMSQFNVKPGERLQPGAVLGRTGRTGGVLGDHLHFGVYIQGIPVNPLEWMDPNFIKSSILAVIERARKVIENEGAIN
jgi:hypothetical protein